MLFNITRKKLKEKRMKNSIIESTKYYLGKCTLGIAILFCWIVVPIGCQPSEVQLSGSIFIVTKGGESIKLGLVEVRAIPEIDVNEYIVAKKRECKHEYDSLTTRIAEVSATLKEMNARWDKVFAKWESAEAGTEASYRYESDTDILNDEIKKVKDVKKGLLQKQLEYIYGHHFFDDLPMGVAIAKTNADGVFKLTVKPGIRYGIVAQANRMVADTSEDYFWFVWTKPDVKRDNEIMLSNDNLVEAHSPESVISNSDVTF
jgi:hypothetical protein